MFVGTEEKDYCSKINVCFVMALRHEDYEAEFMEYSKEKGIVGIKGYHSVGGLRASINIACTIEDIQVLIVA